MHRDHPIGSLVTSSTVNSKWGSLPVRIVLKQFL